MAKRLARRVERGIAVRRADGRQRERRVRDAARDGPTRVPFRVANLGEILRHLVRLYPGPLAGLNEIVTNSADAYREARSDGGTIFVRLRRKPRFELLVEDFSQGMPRSDLAELPQNVASSHKRELDDPTVVGSKGIGVFGALALGARADITSRHASARDTWRLHLAYDHLDQGAELELVEKGGLALPGTRVVVHDIPATTQRVLTVPRIVRYLAEQKREALRAALYRVVVIDEDKKEQTEVRPVVFRGEPLGLHEVRTPQGTITFDLFVHPAPADSRVEVVGRGGNRILADLASLEPFRTGAWASGQVEGTVTYLRLEPTTGRNGIFQDRTYYPQLVHAVRSYEVDVRAALARQRDEAARKLAGKINEALRRIYKQVVAELPPDVAFAARTPVAHPKGEELEGAAESEAVPGVGQLNEDGEGRPGGEGSSTAIDRAQPGRARARWRSYPTWYPDPTMSPDAPRSRFVEAAGAIYLNTQHPDYLVAKAERNRDDARPLLLYQLGLLWKEYLLATDPFADAARQTDDLVGLITRSQRYLPSRI